MAYHHGISLVEVSAGARALTTVATAVIGLVATGPDADATVFPLNRPVLVTDTDAAIGKAGATGTLPGALRAIGDQVRTPIVVVRVEHSGVAATLKANVIGGTVNGQKTGLQALTAAQAQLGVTPRIIGAPGLDVPEVTAALVVVAQKIRAFAYASAVGADVAAAIINRGTYGARELMLIYPDFLATKADGSTGAVPAVAYALGLRAKIDQETGFHKTLSNVPVNGVVGLSRDIQFDIQDAGNEAGLLNAAQICALVRTDTGFRFWGSRTCADDEDQFTFESATRTAHVLADTIGRGLLWAIDKPLRPSLVKDIVETINAELRKLKSGGYILGGKAWFDADKNPTVQLAAGKLSLDYEYTPVPPLEQLGLTQRITDTYLADFATLAAGS